MDVGGRAYGAGRPPHRRLLVALYRPAAAACPTSSIPSSAAATAASTTGSIGQPAARRGSASKLPPDDDLAYARAAASEVLRRNEKNASLPWENPHSGARGTVTPIASAYTEGGQTCRNFLASYVQGRNEAWLTGEACKQGTGRLAGAQPQALEAVVTRPVIPGRAEAADPESDAGSALVLNSGFAAGADAPE